MPARPRQAEWPSQWAVERGEGWLAKSVVIYAGWVCCWLFQWTTLRPWVDIILTGRPSLSGLVVGDDRAGEISWLKTVRSPVDVVCCDDVEVAVQIGGCPGPG